MTAKNTGVSSLETFRDELKRRYPIRAQNAASGSRASAIRMFCLECVGGVRQQAVDCTDTGCFLYQFRPKASPLKKFKPPVSK